jgi:CRISPR-associated protein Csx10
MNGGNGRLRRFFELVLETDAVFPVTAATLGLHATLDHVPGSALLGAAARDYAGFSDAGLAWDAFHSGALRFSNAYPLAGGRPTLPVPLSWHRAKGQVDGSVTNLARTGWSAGEGQPQQVRKEKNWFDQGGALVKLERRFRQKTAIDRSLYGRARKGTLYGYAGIAAGTHFWFELSAPAGRADLIERAARVLTGPGLALGRSRAAEYGAARIVPADGLEEAVTVLERQVDRKGQQVVVYAAADLALVEEATGLPVAGLEPRHLGLGDGWSVVACRVFARGRRWTPFNGARRAFDTDRQVIEKGSVFVFEKDGTITPEDEAALTVARDEGVGLFRAEGLGRILVEPWFLAGERLEVGEARAPEPPAAGMPDGPLGVWLQRRVAARALPKAARAHADYWEDRFAKLYREVWREARAEGRAPFDASPSRAQWGTLRDAVLGLTSLTEIVRVLFGTGTDAKAEGLVVAGIGARAWGSGHWRDPVTEVQRHTTFADLLKRSLEPALLDEALKAADLAGTEVLRGELAAAFLAVLAERMPRRLNALESGKEKAS